jgi:hypothetical protein
VTRLAADLDISKLRLTQHQVELGKNVKTLFQAQIGTYYLTFLVN